MGILQKLSFLSHLVLTMTSILLWLPFGHGHLGSVFDSGRDVRLGGYTFRVHPKKGEPKPPTLELSRDVRGPLLHSPERLDIARLPLFRHPSFTHKTLGSQRLLKFHQGTPSLSASQLRDHDLPTSDASFERLLNRFGNPTENDGNLNPDSPTFTPYISARALSNMEKFFQHLRENLEALQKDEDEDDEDLENESRKGEEDLTYNGSASPEKALASGYQLSSLTPEWKPRASGVLGLKKIRSFFPNSQNPESRSRMGTNLGLGKKRRR